jgi:hypothetical protein
MKNAPSIELKSNNVYQGKKVYLSAVKVFYNGIFVGVIWPFGGDWYCRIFSGVVEGSSRRFHFKKNAKTDAITRATNLSEEEVGRLPGSFIPKVPRPITYSD